MFRFDPEIKMAAIYAMLTLHGFFNCLSYIHETQGWYWFKAQNPLFVLSLRGYNKAYPRFILELKMAVIGWPPKNNQILTLWMTVIDNVRIWLFLTICATRVLNQVGLRCFESYQIVLQDNEETQF